MTNTNHNSNNGFNVNKANSMSGEQYEKLYRKLDEVDKKENTILHLRLQNRVVFVVLLIIILVLSGSIIYLYYSNQRRVAVVLREATWIKDRMALRDLGETDRKERFAKMMIRIMSVHSFKYRKDNIKAMSKEQKEEYINLCYDAAEDFNFPYFLVPTLHKMESAFNPLQDGPYDERGLGQFKWETAMLTEQLLDNLQPYLKKKYYFSLEEKEQLYDPIVNTKATFVLLNYLRNKYANNEMWYISIYHWGGFLNRYYYRGDGQLPKSFKINGIKYAVADYYTTFKEWHDTFESGEVEPYHYVPAKKWQEARKRMVKEEVQLYNAHKEIKKIRKKVRDYEKQKKELEVANEDLKKSLDDAHQKFINLYGELREYDGRSFKAKIKKATGIVHDWMRVQEKKDRTVLYLLWISGSILVLITISVYIFSVNIIYKKIKERTNMKKYNSNLNV